MASPIEEAEEEGGVGFTTDFSLATGIPAAAIAGNILKKALIARPTKKKPRSSLYRLSEIPGTHSPCRPSIERYYPTATASTVESKESTTNFLTNSLAGDSRKQHSGVPRKPAYPISESLRHYLKSFNREQRLPVTYKELEQFQASAPLYDDNDEDTLWQTVIYDQVMIAKLSEGLKHIYAIIKSGGDLSSIGHLYVDRIDYCVFGNSKPFRIRIVNSRNDNQDYFYIKKGDASRIYGLELEHLLSPNRMHFIVDGNTLIEEHIVGLPGDMFIDDWMEYKPLKAIRIAKELIKFNERCFVRLLGDMRPYNFIVDITPDFEGTQIRIRAMDFDQQSYDGRKNFYLPQFFKENNALVAFCTSHIDPNTAHQYQSEVHHSVARRMKMIKLRIKALLEAMSRDRLSPKENVLQLREELSDHYQDKSFLKCDSMGSLVRQSLQRIYESKRT